MNGYLGVMVVLPMSANFSAPVSDQEAADLHVSLIHQLTNTVASTSMKRAYGVRVSKVSVEDIVDHLGDNLDIVVRLRLNHPSYLIGSRFPLPPVLARSSARSEHVFQLRVEGCKSALFPAPETEADH